jgi:hypothetical protein
MVPILSQLNYVSRQQMLLKPAIQAYNQRSLLIDILGLALDYLILKNNFYPLT